MCKFSATLTITIALGFAPIAEAQPGWTGTVRTISPPFVTSGLILQPDLAVGPNGDAYAIWEEPGIPGSGRQIKAARYVAANDSWGAPMTLASSALFVFEVAIDRAGNAFFIVAQRSTSMRIDVHRFTPASGTSAITTVTTDASSDGSPQIVADAAGNAMVVWEAASGIHAARYDQASATWSSPIKISATFGQSPRLAVDGDNDITAIWSSSNTLLTARFDSSTFTWSPATDAPTAGSIAQLQVAADRAGNVTAVWQDLSIVRAARFVAGTWSVATDLSAPGTIASVPRIAADPAGNVIVVWLRGALGSTDAVQTVRYDAGAASWSGVLNLYLSPTSGIAYPSPAVGLDSSGNALALWAQSRPGLGLQILAARYTSAANQWGAPIALSAGGQSALGPNLGFDAGGNAVALWFQSAGGLSAILATRWVEQQPVAPDPPTDLVVASVTGNTVTLAWKAPVSGTPPTGYVLEGGLTAGSVLASVPTGSAATTHTFTAPSGVFFARLHALAGGARSAASNEIQLVVNTPLPPSAPANVLGMVNGSTVALSWTNTFDGGSPTALQLNVSGTQTASLPLGMSDTARFTGVPGGTYTFTLTASNASGVSPPSNPITLTIPGGCSGPPGVPTYFTVARSGRTLTLTWNPPIAGAAVTRYVVHATGAFVGSVPTVTRSLSGTVGAGTYTLSVSAANECGTSAPSPVVTVAVP